MYVSYRVDMIKVVEMFGIVGGCVVVLFFGGECVPRSYNRYKMRYMVGK